MSDLAKIMMAIFIPIGLVLFFVLAVYLVGNVYNGLVRRKNKVEHSYHELTKLLKRSYELIPTLLQSVNMDKAEQEELKDIYKQYSSEDISSCSPYDIAVMDETYQAVLDRLMLTSHKGNEDYLDYLKETRNLSAFSIPLYNHNVRDYQRFKKMIVNKTVAKIFHFADMEEFISSPNGVRSTLDFRFRNFINKGKE